MTQLRQEISEHYQTSDNLVMVGLLRGSFAFMADLARAITVNHSVDFITASSYGNNMESSRDVHILKDLDDNIEGKDVLLVEDIIDTGNTLNKVLLRLIKTNKVPERGSQAKCCLQTAAKPSMPWRKSTGCVAISNS